VSKYTNAERALVKSIVGSLTIKRVPESEIIKEVYRQTNKTISRSGIYNVKQQIRGILSNGIKRSGKGNMNMFMSSRKG
jgi:hypothetical protein